MPITITHGSILESDAQALVNPINCQGIQGKGLALAFVQRFPFLNATIQDAARNAQLKIGQVLVDVLPFTETSFYIFNVPTKDQWQHPSTVAYVTAGLEAIRRTTVNMRVQSLAIPALGCGLGGLRWSVVKPLILETCAAMAHVNVTVYEPLERAR